MTQQIDGTKLDGSKFAKSYAIDSKEIYILKQSLVSISGLNSCRSLKTLDLTQNSLISVDLSGVSNSLRELSLSRNELTEIIGLEELENLEEFEVYDNKLRKLQNLTKLKKLRILYLSGNLFDDLSNVGIETFANLRELCLNNNRLTEIPNLENCVHLVKLWLENNKLVTLPQGINMLAKLKELFLDNNELTELPDFANFPQLESLQIHRNPGVIVVRGLESLAQLRYIRIDLDLLSCELATKGREVKSMRDEQLDAEFARQIVQYAAGGNLIEISNERAKQLSKWKQEQDEMLHVKDKTMLSLQLLLDEQTNERSEAISQLRANDTTRKAMKRDFETKLAKLQTDIVDHQMPVVKWLEAMFAMKEASRAMNEQDALVESVRAKRDELVALMAKCDKLVSPSKIDQHVLEIETIECELRKIAEKIHIASSSSSSSSDNNNHSNTTSAISPRRHHHHDNESTNKQSIVGRINEIEDEFAAGDKAHAKFVNATSHFKTFVDELTISADELRKSLDSLTTTKERPKRKRHHHHQSSRIANKPTNNRNNDDNDGNDDEDDDDDPDDDPDNDIETLSSNNSNSTTNSPSSTSSHLTPVFDVEDIHQAVLRLDLWCKNRLLATINHRGQMRNAAAKANYRLQWLVGASKATMLDDYSKIDDSLTSALKQFASDDVVQWKAVCTTPISQIVATLGDAPIDDVIRLVRRFVQASLKRVEKAQTVLQSKHDTAKRLWSQTSRSSKSRPHFENKENE